MTTFDKIKKEILAWSVVAIAFGALTFAALNLDSIRQYVHTNAAQANSVMEHESVDFQPGISVVLAQ